MKHSTRMIMLAVAALIAILLAVAGLWARGVADAATAGRAEVQAGVKLLASQDATGAASRFGAASRTFSRARAMLGPEWLGSMVDGIPLAGRQYSTARTLVAIGLDGSKAGAELAAALKEAPAASAGGKPVAGFGSVLVTGRPHIDSALASLTDAADRAALLSDSGLVPTLSKAVRSVKAALSDVAPLLDRSHALLSLDTYLLVSKRRILVVSQDGAELRPTGGFMGSYGVIEVGPEGVKLEKYQDVYALPDPRRHVAPPPGLLMVKDFTFRDANWWMDFPTSARTMLGFWKDAGQPPVDGVIAVDPIAMRDLLEVLGPVRVASYSETFTADNLLTRLLRLVEVKGAGPRNNKGVLTALAGELERRVAAAGGSELANCGLALAKAADAKHVQVYFSNDAAEAAIAELRWSGRVAPPAGTTDLLAVSNSMNKGSKANVAMSKTMAYTVALKPDRSADTTLVLGYSYTGPAQVPYGSVFRDYVRVYRAPGTIILPDPTPAPVRRVRTRTAAASANGNGSIVELGLPAAVRTFGLARGGSHVENVTSRIPPGAWRAGGAPTAGTRAASIPSPTPSADDRSAYYRLVLVTQADLQDVPTKVTVTSPTGWHVSDVSAQLVASGRALPATRDKTGVRLSLPLSGDVLLDVALTRDSAGGAKR